MHLLPPKTCLCPSPNALIKPPTGVKNSNYGVLDSISISDTLEVTEILKATAAQVLRAEGLDIGIDFAAGAPHSCRKAVTWGWAAA